MFAGMDISAMDSTSYGSTSSDSTVIDSEEDDRAFIEISELDKLLGLPPPRFDLSAAETDSIKVFDSAESNSNFDSDTDLTVPHKPGLPQRLKMDNRSSSETEVCYNKELEKVSVIKSELTIGSDGQEVETECNSYLTETVPVPVPPSSTDDMLYDRSPVRGCSQADSVISKVLAKTDGNSIHLQCLQPCDISNQIPKKPATIPSPVLNKLKKLGTSVVVEQPASASHPSACETGENPKTENIHPGYLEIMETIDKAVDLTSDLTKKRKRALKKTIKDQVPSLDKTLEQVENSYNKDNIAKFCFQVNISQIINISDQEKLYSCDICSGVYGRGFSLKRHYLKTHINHKHISKHDLHNCGIAVDPSVARGVRKKKKTKDDSPPVVSNLSPPNDIPDLYRCHTCHQCFMLISDLKAHLMEHPPISVRNLAENNFKNYTCAKCDARYQNKKMFLRHQEMCQPKVPLAPEYFCLYCHLSFSSHKLQKLHQLQMHHPKKKLHKCYLCNTKIFKDRSQVFKHLISHHSDDYFACFTCKLRVVNWEALKKHNRENHKHLNNVKHNQQNIVSTEDENKNEDKVQEDGQGSNIINDSNSGLTLKCTECPKIFASHLNMTRHRRLAHKEVTDKKRKIIKKKENTSIKVIKNVNKRKTPTPPPKECVLPQPQPPDPDVVFYSCVALNVKENLTHHLDGKLDSQEILDYDLNKSITEQEPQIIINPEEAKSIQPESAKSTIFQHKERRSAPISPRVPWEKFNFPKNYDGRCGLTFMKDLSCLDIATQIIVKRNLARQESSSGKENSKESPANIPAGLLLVENNKMETDCAEAFGDPNDKDGESSLQLSGEWVWPHTYLCAACGYKSTNLWDTEDHKFALHPNVWVPHIEIVAEKSSEWDWFYHRRLPPGTEVEMTTPAMPVAPLPCSKCQRQCATTADLHRHMLDCGGDTTWMATMLPMASPGTRRRKWRPFGSRRRRQQGRRGLKRNIPNTPAKHSCGRIRTKPGDMDTIQKMIANLPAKRSTRRVIGEDPDIKTRSQGTYNSVRSNTIFHFWNFNL
uniref:C2H2-type domain-containing protein n=1 Tax=Cuerna arida TaxID=1464854 RepID=A0A1B6FYD7_9HEMI